MYSFDTTCPVRPRLRMVLLVMVVEDVDSVVHFFSLSLNLDSIHCIGGMHVDDDAATNCGGDQRLSFVVAI